MTEETKRVLAVVGNAYNLLMVAKLDDLAGAQVLKAAQHIQAVEALIEALRTKQLVVVAPEVPDATS